MIGAHLDDALRDRFVCGLHQEATQRKLLTMEGLMLQKAYETAYGMEAADKQASKLQALKASGEPILVSHYSPTAVKVFGRNNIAILATLFLLSYSKALKTIISALSASQVLVSDADNVSAPVLPYTVWSYDGNIEYLKGKHVVLFTVALIFLLVLFLPYTLLLTFGQWLRSLPLRRRLILKLTHSTAFISIMDAYHAPYNIRHRYWTGLMLLTRCVLFLAFATVYSNNEVVVNSFITALVISGILLIKTCCNTVYKMFWLNILELSFLYNLEVLSAALYYLKAISVGDDNTMACKATNASISISFITFIGIAAYHAYLQVRRTRFYIYAKKVVLSKFSIQLHQVIPTEYNEKQLSKATSSKGILSTTLVELREDLLGSNQY